MTEKRNNSILQCKGTFIFDRFLERKDACLTEALVVLKWGFVVETTYC